MEELTKKQRRFRIFCWTLFILIVLTIVGLNWPLPNYFIESPGTADSLKNFVTVDGKKDTQKGTFMLTTVRLSQATPYKVLKARQHSFDEVIPRAELMSNQTSNAQYNQLQKYYMETAENTAAEVALKLAHKPYKMKYQGIYVMDFSQGSNFKNKLQVGDLITAVNGHHFNSAKETIDYIQSQKVGQEVTVQYERQGKTGEAKGKLTSLEGTKKPGLGIILVTKPEVSSPIKIKINAGDIGGPSAGLMFTLETYEMLTHKDLRHGRKIAGTGEIAPNGEVGRIGGIDKKVVAASKAGATIFFAPDDEITKEMKQYDPHMQSNYEEAKQAAKKIHTKMKIVPVKTVEDAIRYLEQHP